LTPSRIQIRIITLKEDWEKFSLVHKAIKTAIQKLSSEEKLKVQNHLYFSENLFAITHECYLESIERMSLLLDSDHGTSQRMSSI